MAKSEKRLRKLQAKQGVAVGPLNDKLADNVVFACFQGLLRVTHEVVSQEARSQRDDAAAGTALATVETKVADVNFLHLTLDLPPAPLYKDQYVDFLFPFPSRFLSRAPSPPFSPSFFSPFLPLSFLA